MKLRYKIINSILGILVIAIVVLAITIGRTDDCEPSPSLSTDSTTIAAIVYRCYGSPDVLEYTQISKPIPADNELLVKVVAAAVNPLDWHYMRGEPYLMRLMSGLGSPENSGLGTDFSGIVVAIGKDVTSFKVGDKVFGGARGSFAEYLTINEKYGVALKPENMTFQESASVAIAGITAIQALNEVGNLQPGQKVLINGASGGVGTFAVQIAKAMGAEVTGVSSTKNHSLVLSLGADYVIDYKTENYTESSVKYDLIIDMVGNHSLLDNRKAMTEEGILVMIGSSEKGNWVAPLLGPLAALVVEPFVSQNFEMFIAVLKQKDMQALGKMMAEGKLKPVLGESYPLSEVADAIRLSETGHAKGKIIIEIGVNNVADKDADVDESAED